MPRWTPDAEDRLMQAALELFDAQGYDRTTVAQIAERAGLTKRTFFRYFTDKREVLFDRTEQLRRRWIDGIAAAPDGTGPMSAVFAGLDPVAELFLDRHAYARVRARVIGSHPDLQERELIKLQSLAAAIEAALIDRGVAPNAAALTAQAGVTVFHVAFARWLEQDDPAALRRLLDDALRDLREVTAS